jgi:predicted alpha-1,2-mannosidase
LEYAYDDWCIATVAQKLNKTEDFNFFSKRGENYRNIFDSSTGFMRGKLENGKWIAPFDPLVSNHFKSDYTEGNAWQYVWFVPQNIPGLVELLGGKETFYLKLDSLFTTEEAVRGKEASPDISGLIGQYAHGNEPSHSTAYLFNECGQAWRTQELVRFIQTTMYYNGVEGICGNEDCGQMSAWYVLSSMGIYPVNAADQKYRFGSPLFDNIEINLSDDKVFTIKAINVSDENKYIQSVSLNGEALNRSYITHDELAKGGILEFVMGNKPKKELFN